MLEPRKERLCFFDFCISTPTEDEENYVQEPLLESKRNKMSLKRNMQKSYAISQTNSKIMSPPAFIQTRVSEPLY